MKERFFDLSERLARELRAGEVLLCNFSAERSDFVRFNQGRVRQAGTVEQQYLSVRLVRDGRHATASLALSGNGEDLGPARAALLALREVLGELTEDPWLSIAEEPRATSSERRGALAEPESVVDETLPGALGRDLVGIYAGGPVYRGFANSLGQRNWHETQSFHFDWSLHGAPDQAVKGSHAGFDWDGELLGRKIEAAAGELALLAAVPRRIEPGEYRTYLAPAALEEMMGLLCWGGFSARAHATGQSPLLRLAQGEVLSPIVTLTENTREGLAPDFQSDGFVKPPGVILIGGGKLAEALVSPRTAREYALATNAADAGESPESLDLSAGRLAAKDVLSALDTGLYVSNLWYLNYSDRAAGRITGMMRFATFWVEHGRITAPVAPMRFDDSIVRIFGESLLDLTTERELLIDPSTYEERSTSSARLPGALLASLRFTL